MTDGLSPKKWRRFDKNYDAFAEARAAALLAEKEEAKPQYGSADIKIAVVGAQQRIGTTSFAIHLADYFMEHGATPAIVNHNTRGDMQLEMMCDIYEGIDNGNGSYRIKDMEFYGSEAVIETDHSVEIHDFGALDGVIPDFNGFDKLYLVGGTSWSELPLIYQAQKELNATNYTAIINYATDEAVKRHRDILSFNLNEVIRAPYEPDTFSSAAYEEIFDSEFDDFRDEMSDDESEEQY